MRWVLVGIAALVVLVAAVSAAGAMLPRAHVATSRVRIGRPAGEVWRAVADLASWPSWNTEIKKMERLADREGRPVWACHGGQGAMTMEVVEEIAPEAGRSGRLVTRIADESLPFGGSWSWDVAPDGDGVVVAITEDGFIKNPIFRFMARFVFGYHATMESYLKALGGKFGQEVAPERVERRAA